MRLVIWDTIVLIMTSLLWYWRLPRATLLYELNAMTYFSDVYNVNWALIQYKDAVLPV